MQQSHKDKWKNCEGETIADQYYLEQLLGSGSYGGVFRAAQIVAGKKQSNRVAVKLSFFSVVMSRQSGMFGLWG
jgi:hypothetical protein